MSFIKITTEYGLIIRKDALAERGVAFKDILAELSVAEPLDSNDRLLSFGPLFGRETVDSLIKSFVKMGLKYIDDFTEIVGDYPAWCQFQVGYAEASDGER